MPDTIKPTQADRDAALKIIVAWSAGRNGAMREVESFLALHAQQAREQALEEAASIADRHIARAVPHYEFSKGYSEAKALIATAIRALKEHQQ